MPLDHYVSQVHLRNFYSPALDGMMNGIKKSDLKRFPCKSENVCRIEDGSTNAYLKEDRAIEEFLKAIEPTYNAALETLESGEIDAECILTIAGFIAYVSSCAPAAMRIHSEPLRKNVEATAAILDKQGILGPSPPALGGKTLTELLKDGTVNVKIDPKYPQALGITTILRRVSLFGNSPWQVLINTWDDSPFFTSDFPTAIEETDDPRVLARVVPLSPRLAVRIMPNLARDGDVADLKFSKFSYERRHNVKRQAVSEINRLIVRCAEELVFFRDDRDWIVPFITKNRAFRIEPSTSEFPHGSGTLLWSTQRITPTAPSNS